MSLFQEIMNLFHEIMSHFLEINANNKVLLWVKDNNFLFLNSEIVRI